jgi:Uma2 family endonuclease
MGEVYRIPDVMVRPRHGSGGPLTSDYATFIAEVLSPGSEKEDLTRKPREYLAVPELQDYVVFVQGEAVAWHWSRRADGSFPPESADIRGLAAELPIPGLGLALPMADLYFGTDVSDG